MQRSHAIANGVYVASPNRIGHEDEPGTDGIKFFGHSFIADPFGRYIAEAGERRGDPRSRTCDPALIETVRRNWPFLRDRRIDAYGPILSAISAHDVDARRAAGGCPPSGSRTARPGSRGRTTSPTGRASSRRFPGSTREIARVLAEYEPVEILCHSETVRRERAARCSTATACARDRVRLHLVPNDRVWLRDSAPTGVIDATGAVALLNWAFNALGEVRQLARRRAGRRGDRATSPACRASSRRVPTTARRWCSKAAASRPNGDGLLLVTEEWLLSDVQVRNPGPDARRTTSRRFAEWLGMRQTIWLGEGCVGDDTHGHVDDIARFVARGHDRARGRRGSGRREPRAIDGQPAAARARRRAIRGRAAARRARCRIRGRVIMNGERLPASYANFYIANGVVLVPTFNDPNDRVALNIAGGADARPPGRRHPRGRSGLGPGHAALPDAAGTGKVRLRGRTRPIREMKVRLKPDPSE